MGYIKFLPRFLLMGMLICLFGMLGCGVRPADVVGTWVMTDSSRRFLPTELQSIKTKLILQANGTFIASNLPDDWSTPRDASTQFQVRPRTGSGSWKIIAREGRQQIQLDFNMIAGNPAAYGTQVDVSKGWSAVDLYYFLGDPDQKHRILLEKK